jgi:HK97 family phage prohead protease
MRAAGGSGDADALRIEGYAAVFDGEFHHPAGFVESIKRGAFSRALAEKQDVRALINHDANMILGRTKNGTVRLRQDSKGLWFSVDLPNTQVARDLHASISRGDIDQCSFSFKPLKETWGDRKQADGSYVATRLVEDLDLFDVSAVTYPAYATTSVQANSVEVPAEVRQLVEQHNSTPEKRDTSNPLDAERESLRRRIRLHRVSAV